MTGTGEAGARLEVQNVSMRFSGIRVLEDVTFTAQPGTVHAIIGPNGAGKSTLFNILSGIYQPVAGHIRLDGDDMLGLAPHHVARLGVGRAFQNSSMFSSLTVEENLLLGQHRLTKAGVMSCGLAFPSARAEEKRARARVREVAQFMGIDGLLDHPSGELPYGDAKRVDIARALCPGPKLLLLDEPAAGMHTHEKAAIQATIKQIVQETATTVLLVEHDMHLVMGISDHITALNFGTVLLTGTSDEVRNDPQVIEAYLGHDAA